MLCESSVEYVECGSYHALSACKLHSAYGITTAIPGSDSDQFGTKLV